MFWQRIATIGVLLVTAGLMLVSGRRLIGDAFTNYGMQKFVQAATRCGIEEMWREPANDRTRVQCSEQSVELIRASIYYLERGLKWHRGSLVGYRNLGNANMLLGNQEQALNQFSQAARLDQSDSIAQFRLGQLYAAMGKDEEALAAWKQAGAARFFLQRGKWYLEQARYGEAEQCFSLAVTIDAWLGEGYWRLGQVQDILGKDQQAARSYRQFANLEQNETAPQYAMLGAAYRLEHDFARAIESYERAIELNPADETYYFDLGMVLVKAGDREQAIRVLKQGVREAPAYVHTLSALGEIYSAHDCVEATYWYQQAIQIYPQSYSPWLGIARCEYAQGEFSQALDSLHMAEARGPQAPEIHYWLGQSYVQLGKLEEAANEFKQAIQLGENYRYHQALADLYYAQRDFDQALAQYRRVVALDPDNALARERVEKLSQ